jgi:nucleoid-associated protein YgaU
VAPEAIISLNNLRNPNRIFPGQVLLIPAPSASPTP